ncbi:MAG: hypothetical protein QXD03_01530 [Candidatus Anstonellales archaeon]
MQAVLEQKVDKELVWLSEVQRLSLDQLKKLDAEDGKLDGKVSLNVKFGSRTVNINLTYNEKGEIYLVMNDGQRVKIEQGSIIAINGDTGRYTLIKPVDPKISPAHTIHNLMGKGWHALYFDNGALYHSSLNPEAAIARVDGNFERLKQLKGRDLRDFEFKIGDRPVGYADWRAQERSIPQSQENGQMEEKIDQQVKNVGQSKTQQESRSTVSTSLNTGTSFKPKTQQEARYNDSSESSMADYRDRIYQEYRQGERNPPSAIVEQNPNIAWRRGEWDSYGEQSIPTKDIYQIYREGERKEYSSSSNQIPSSNQAVSSEQVSSGNATTKKLDNQQDKTTNDQLHDITGSKYQANLLESAYHALSRRYPELTFESYIELVKKHFSDPNNNFVDSYRALMKEVYEKYGKKEAVEERGGTSDQNNLTNPTQNSSGSETRDDSVVLTSGESVRYHGVNYTLNNNELEIRSMESKVKLSLPSEGSEEFIVYIDPLGGLKVVPYQSMSIGSSFRVESLPEEYTKITLTPYGGVFIERKRKQG